MFVAGWRTWSPNSVAGVTAAIGATVGIAVLAGWAFDVPALKSVVPGFIAMQPWTATSLVLAAVALRLAASAAPTAQRASALPAFALMLAAGTPLLEHTTGLTSGTDVWLFPLAVLHAQPFAYPNPGRISQTASIGLAALAGALILARHVRGRSGRTAFSLLATAALTSALAALVDYALRLEPLTVLFLRNPVALHTAFVLAALSIGTLSLHSDAGWLGAVLKQGRAGWAIAGMLSIAALLLSVGSQATTRVGTIAANQSAVLFRLQILLTTLVNAETGQRGYLLTGKVAYLAPFDVAARRLPEDFANLQSTLVAVEEKPSILLRLHGLAAEKMVELQQTVSVYQSGHAAKALAKVETDDGRAIMDLIRTEVVALERSTAESAAVRSSYAWRIVLISGLGLLAFAIPAAWMLTTVVRVRDEIAALLAERESQQRYQLATLGLGNIMERSLDGTVHYWAAGCERLLGWTEHEAVGRLSHELLGTVYGMPRSEIEATLKRTGEWIGELRLHTRDGRELTMTTHKMLRRGTEGAPDIVLEILTDVTAQRRAEISLRDSQALLRTVMEATPGLIYAKDRQGRMLLGNSAASAVTGKPWALMVGRTDHQILDDPAKAAAIMANDREVMESCETQSIEETVGEVIGQPRVWLSTKSPIFDLDGKVTGLVGVSVDISERKRDEGRLRLMVNELNHRVKNTLATVQSIALQTLRDVDLDIRQKVEGRLQALAAVHDVLTRESWKEANLHEVSEGVLAPHGGADNTRFHVSGPTLCVQSRVAVALSMALHELATNAIKYGALSNDTGIVTIRWTITEDARSRFQMVWSEQGGPPVVAPASRGFGTRLIERSLATDLGGTARITFEPSGVACTIDAPLHKLTATTNASTFPLVGALAGT